MDGTQTGGAPNHFELEGDGLRLTFDTTSITGRPLLSYADANTSAQFTGDDLRIEQGGLGTLVTVGVGPFVDASNTTFTLVVPGFAGTGDGPCAVATFGVVAEHRLSADAGSGQLDSYRTVSLTGTASLVAS